VSPVRDKWLDTQLHFCEADGGGVLCDRCGHRLGPHNNPEGNNVSPTPGPTHQNTQTDPAGMTSGKTSFTKFQ
jgi:hypothetical protein